ncbi:hypothetical protein A2926_01900 [Candidatus Giovannonibacteria bacterium RIFCSPLOWO2_01_FULL_44_40]|uniref:Glycosyltransferase 2-like domain-containing protein n=1 Tax=Candidatus Giovannonibacteria bacterium RIFCSPHIGHO2_01_FULL_45_23 TaxID=1798325 RepID=A0A1F5VHP6_9BACT|nr:MAG: hypothetical protein A2834_03270 [Candidatus Giovannonibacteria bacterium RIFCSPHIGHO2_01_FULL_45_23]OGF76910.1 MAG: hypothetical protein A3C77_04760 [Candidatus Giovannonibacteria bacterium RIFCSPHIGHO2_02_FULL_45_13]OGF80281.1 MAG: hypothetical protein A2926_01900 [Candidatus Giovannonibacteria bacterium RIFCSPLOWO2_01_FULL_44_40]
MEQRKVSVVVPVFNEGSSLGVLHSEILDVFKKTRVPFEIIYVDDGSFDNTWEILSKLPQASAISLQKNFGQTVALAAGIERASGDIIVTLDGDLENDPNDIPDLLDKLNSGYDIVSGWRVARWRGQFLTRKLPSILANAAISYVTGAKLHDHGCTLKAYKKEAIKNLQLSGDAHRMLAAYAYLFNKARIAELAVNHRARKFGKSHYGPMRSFKVLMDLLSLSFFHRYSNRPMYFFGGVGFVSLFLALIFFLDMLYRKYFLGVSFIQTPLPVLVALGVMIGAQFILMGLLAEFFQWKLSRPLYYQIKQEVINK